MVSRDLPFPQAYMLRLYLEYAELFGAPEEEKSRSSASFLSPQSQTRNLTLPF
jgi:hypothetical protein